MSSDIPHSIDNSGYSFIVDSLRKSSKVSLISSNTLGSWANVSSISPMYSIIRFLISFRESNIILKILLSKGVNEGFKLVTFLH